MLFARASLLLIVAATAAACSSEDCDIPLGDVHEVDPALAFEDTSDPVVVGAVSYAVGEPSLAGCDAGCEGVQILTIRVRATDNLSAIEQIGFVFELVSGSLPLSLPLDPVRGDSFDGDTAVFFFDWDDAAPIQASARVTPIDLAGNQGAAAIVTINEPAGPPDELATTRSSALALLIVPLVFVRRRSRYHARS